MLLGVVTACLGLSSPLAAQVALTSGTNTQAFDTLSSGLPTGWSVYTGATTSSLGTAATLTAATTPWSTTGQWANVAAADASGLTSSSTTAQQAAATDRALGIRQTAAVGDPGASANYYFSTLGLQVSSISFSAQQLSAQPRSTTWSLQYSLGASPTSWTTIATVSDPAAWGATTVTGSGFGSALDGQANVWIRIVALSSSTGSGNRDGFGIDDFTIVTTGSAVATAPTVTSTTPASSATLVALSSTVTVVFDQSVTLADGWFTLTGSSSGTHAGTVTGSGTTWVITPTTPFSESETVTLTVSAAQVTASTGGLAMSANYTASFTTALNSATIRKISFIQGSGSASAYTGQTVSLQGIVTGFYLTSSGTRDGFYLQQKDAEVDGDDATSEGIYVYMSDNTASLATALAALAVGDEVTVKGTVKEYSNLTEFATVSALSVLSSSNVLPAAKSLTLPLASSTYLERYEGMRVTLPQTLYVTDTYYLGQYGEFGLSSGGLLAQPTNVVSPGTAATTLQAANTLNYLTIDDGSAATYRDPTSFLYTTGSDTTTATLRCGDTTTGVTGVITYIGSLWMVEPTAALTFANANPRTAPPALAGSVRVVGANVLNFFNGDGAGSGYPTSRGATTYIEYQRQRTHVIAALSALNADVYGLTELENDGFGSTSAIQDLVNGLNAAAAAGDTYAFVDLGLSTVGTDAITCGLIYKTNAVALVGSAAVNTSSTFNRPPIAQTFRQISNGEVFTVCINHFKSKGTSGASGSNADLGDGQSAWNYLRTQQANELTTWLATDPTGSADPDVLIIGDLNSYAKEDPITAIVGAGYTNLVETLEGAGGYSYAYDGQFGHLDHALATSSLAAQAIAAESWHNNSVEPAFIDYNVENKSTSGTNYTTNTVDVRWRASDHDPVLIDLLLLAPQQSWRSTHFGTTANSGNAADAADPDGDGLVNVLEYALGSDPTSATSATLPTGAIESGSFVFRFTRPTSTTDLTYAVETSTDLLTWTTLGTSVESSTSTTQTLVASFTPTATKQFVRLSVGGVTTVPVGYLSVTLTGSGATTTFGVPLEDPAGPASGLRAGQVESFTATTLTNSSGGWAANALSATAAPWAVRFTSGTAAGKLVDIASNTATTLTLKNADLISAGVAVGDRFELVAIDTLNTFFGASTLAGSSASSTADLVKLYGSSWVSYFYSTALNYWRLTTLTTNFSQVAVRPLSGLQVTRRGTSLTFTQVGRVLDTKFRATVANAGNTLLSLGYPMDTTLAGLAVQSRLSGWRTGTTTAADQVYLYNGSAWVGYVYTGTRWQTVSGGTASDTVSIPAGSALLITRPGTTSGSTEFIQNLPY